MKRHLVIVGGSLVGHRAALAARRLDREIEITVLGAERHPPYQRPPLSKQLLAGSVSPDRVYMHGGNTAYTLRPGTVAHALDTSQKLVATSAGEVSYDLLVIGTGARPVQLAELPPGPSVIYLRTLDDALLLRSLFQEASAIAVVGAGFVGLEVASAARHRGIGVTVIDRALRPLASVAGSGCSRVVQQLHEENGVEFLLGTTVTSWDPLTGTVTTGTGAERRVQAVVVGAGVVPATEWVEGELPVEAGKGVLAGADGCVEGYGQLGVAGDAGSWFHPLYGRYVHVEHYETAATQAAHLAANLLTDQARPLEEIPFCWSEQHGTLLQVLGPRSEYATEIELDTPSGKGWGYLENGRLEQVILLGSGANLDQWRQEITAQLRSA